MKKSFLRVGLIAIITLLGSACSHVSTRVYNIPVLAGNDDAIDIVDLRPASEKVFKLRSSWTTDCEFGISDFGDKNLSPPPMQILKSNLSNALRPKQNPLRVEVHSFRVINNLQAMIRSISLPTPESTQAAFDNATLTGKSGVVAAATEIGVRGTIAAMSCNADSKVIGGIDPATNPSGSPQILVIIDVVLEGNHYEVRHVELYRGRTTDQTTATAVLAATGKLAEKLNSSVSSSEP